MSKKIKLIIITVISVVVLVLAVGIGFVVFMNSQQNEMTPLGNKEVIPGIYAINNGFVNIYLIQRGDMYIAIDAGMSVTETRKGLDILGISSDDVAVVLLTHSHGDHIGALNVFDKSTVYAANLKYADTLVADGDTFTVMGIEIQVISTPGHADDSVCYVYDGNYLFAGDNLSLKSDRVWLFNSVYNKSDDQQKADIQKLAGLTGISYIFTAHYGYTDKAIFP